MIGIFDSGIGGLSVVRELLKRHPDADFLYLGDTARTPYGNKSPETITRYAIEDAAFLISHGATHVIAACNTVSAVAMPTLRDAFPSVEFFDVITPAVSAAAEVAHQKKRGHVGVIGTRATVSSGLYEKLLREAGVSEIISDSCPLFVPLVEEGWVNRPETKRIARVYLSRIRQAQVDALILGCTHYPFLEQVIASSLQKRVQLIDSPSALLNLLERDCPEVLASTGGKQKYFFTDPANRVKAIAEKWLKRPIEIELAKLKTSPTSDEGE